MSHSAKGLKQKEMMHSPVFDSKPCVSFLLFLGFLLSVMDHQHCQRPSESFHAQETILLYLNETLGEYQQIEQSLIAEYEKILRSFQNDKTQLANQLDAYIIPQWNSFLNTIKGFSTDNEDVRVLHIYYYEIIHSYVKSFSFLAEALRNSNNESIEKRNLALREAHRLTEEFHHAIQNIAEDFQLKIVPK